MHPSLYIAAYVLLAAAGCARRDVGHPFVLSDPGQRTLTLGGTAKSSCLGTPPLRGKEIELLTAGGRVLAQAETDVLGHFVLTTTYAQAEGADRLYVRIREEEGPIDARAPGLWGRWGGRGELTVTIPCDELLPTSPPEPATAASAADAGTTTSEESTRSRETELPVQPDSDRPAKIRLTPR